MEPRRGVILPDTKLLRNACVEGDLLYVEPKQGFANFDLNIIFILESSAAPDLYLNYDEAEPVEMDSSDDESNFAPLAFAEIERIRQTMEVSVNVPLSNPVNSQLV